MNKTRLIDFCDSTVARVTDSREYNGYLYVQLMQGAKENDNGAFVPAQSFSWALSPADQRALLELLRENEPVATIAPLADPEDERHAIKQLAHALDPECWVSYSGKPREFKRAIDKRRTAALQTARMQYAQSLVQE